MRKLRIGFSAIMMLILMLTFSMVAFAAAPTAPTKFTTTVTGGDDVKVDWADVGGATSYNVYWGTATATPVNVLVSDFTINDQIFKKHSFWVEAVNADGVSAKKMGSVVVGALPYVTETVTDNDAKITWNAVEGAAYYNVYWGSTSTFAKKVLSSETLEFTMTDLAIGKYTFAVEPVDAKLIGTGPATGNKAPKFQGSVFVGELNVTETVNADKTVTLTWTAPTDGADSYNVYWNHGAAVNVTATTFTSVALNPGVNYDYSVEAVKGSNKSPLFTGSVTANADYTGTAWNKPVTAGTENNKVKDPNSVIVGNVDNFGKDSTHRTHGNFQNNTNSCANCHSTHNAAEGSYLMMKSTEYELCMACHDGTMGFYNVQVASGAGVFNENDGHASASMHDVNSDLLVKSAPGAFTNTSTAELQCSSCHSPHGSVNDRLLSAKVISKLYAFNYEEGPLDSHGSPSYNKTTPMAEGTKSINLDLVLDPDYASLNNISGTGLKIYESHGPKGNTDKMNFSNYCSVCHDDYLAKRSDGKVNGTTFTHTTNSHKDGRNCASCHYSHGTDITTLMDSSGRTVADLQKTEAQGGEGFTEAQAKEYMKDVRGDSSIKKFTNMAVCFSCHAADVNTGGEAAGIDISGVPGGAH